MFAQSIGVRDGSRRFARLTVIVSVLVHGAAGMGLMAYSFWKINKLNPRTEELVFRAGGLPSMGSPAPPAATPQAVPLKRAPLARPGEVVQPTTHKAVTPATGPADGTFAPGGTGNGDGSGEPGGEGTEGLGQGSGPPQLVVEPPAEIPVVEKAPEMIPQARIEGQRRSGTREILLPPAVLSSLRAEGVSKLSVHVRLCLDATGAPSSLAFGAGGRAEVNDAIARELNRWRYSPYVVNGEAVPTCFMVFFNYTIQP